MCVGNSDPTAIQKKVEKVRKMMDKELGYVDASKVSIIGEDQKVYTQSQMQTLI